MSDAVETDPISGQTINAHEWDGIRELNTPMPIWWVYTFVACILFAVGYWVVYPAIPLWDHYTPGIWGYNSRVTLNTDLAAQADKFKAQRDRIAALSVQDIAKDHDLLSYALKGGDILFRNNCQPCHQSGGSGAPGYPVLSDNVWLWGGTLDAIQTTITHGIRSEKDADTHQSIMPAWGRDKLLTADQINQVVDYVVAMETQHAPASGPGREVYVANCAACHSSDGANPISDGNQMVGAPPLGSGVGLYSGPNKPVTKEIVYAQVYDPRHGVMPAWADRLNPSEIKELTLYVHELGGGQ